jgi:hypothetical protein
MNVLFIIIFLPLCVSDRPYLIRSYPSDSIIIESSFTNGPCLEPIKTLPFLQGTDDISLNHSECIYDSDESILTCKLGLTHAASSLNLDQYPVDKVNVLILFVQEFPEKNIKSRVLNLCFINNFGKSLRELAICGYQPPRTRSSKYSYLHILDISTLAIVASKIQTLLISGILQTQFNK